MELTSRDVVIQHRLHPRKVLHEYPIAASLVLDDRLLLLLAVIAELHPVGEVPLVLLREGLRSPQPLFIQKYGFVVVFSLEFAVALGFQGLDGFDD